MNSNKNKYVFKYDKHNNLYSYIERSFSKSLISLYTYNYKNNSMIRYDKDNQLRIFTQYDEPCKLVQRFEAGESWVKSVPFNQTIYAHQSPKIKKQFALKTFLVFHNFQQLLYLNLF